MSTLADVESDLETAFDADGLTIMTTPFRRDRATTRGQRYVAVSIASTNWIVVSSNVSRQVADVEVLLVHRAAGSTVANIAAAEAVIVGYLSDYTQLDFWTDLTSVAQSPLPDIEIESEPERIGECIEASIRAQIVIEV